MNMEEVFEILSNVGPKKECVRDKISGRMMKNDAKILTGHILKTAKLSLHSKFPSGCKTATQKPICEKQKSIAKELQTCFTSACNI